MVAETVRNRQQFARKIRSLTAMGRASAYVLIGLPFFIAWDDPTEAIPAFLTIIMMPLAVSITEGVAFGLLAYVVLKLATGRGREVHALIYVFAILFLARYAFLR